MVGIKRTSSFTDIASTPFKTSVPRCVFRTANPPEANTSNVLHKFDKLALNNSDSDIAPSKKSHIVYYLLIRETKIKLSTYPFSVGFGSKFNFDLYNALPEDNTNFLLLDFDDEKEFFRLYINANHTLDLITLNSFVLVNGNKVEHCITLVRGDVITIPKTDIFIKIHLEYEPTQDLMETALLKVPICSQEPGSTLIYVFAIYDSTCDSDYIRKRSMTINTAQFVTPRAGFTHRSADTMSHASQNSTPELDVIQEVPSLSLPGSPAIKIYAPPPSSARTPDTRMTDLGNQSRSACPFNRVAFVTETPLSPSHLLWSTYVRERMQEQEEKMLSTHPSIASGRLAAEYFTCLSLHTSATLAMLKAEFDKQLEYMGISNKYHVYAEMGKDYLDDRLDKFWVFQLGYLNTDSEDKVPAMALKYARIKPIQHARVLYIHFY